MVLYVKQKTSLSLTQRPEVLSFLETELPTTVIGGVDGSR